MITYVNTVLVSSAASSGLATQISEQSSNVASADAGKYVIMNCDDNVSDDAIYSGDVAEANTIKVGMITKNNIPVVKADGSVKYYPVVKWSNEIKKADIKSIKALKASDFTPSEDKVTIDFTGIDTNVVLPSLAEGGKRVIVRLTFKDLPTRFRKWTESYEYVTKNGETAETLASGIAALINKQIKRARVVADGTGTSGKLVLTAMPYDDDNSVDSISPANKVRFNANIYYTDPTAAAFASNNKYFPTGVKIEKTPGVQYPAEAKLVRDREAQAMGYLGILNRGEGTWPVIKPAMETDLSKTYDAVTLEFENMYRAADDIFRKTKQTVELYAADGAGLSAVKAKLDEFISGEGA